VIPWAPDLIEAYVIVGRTRDGLGSLETLEGQAARTGGTWAAATAARCRGLLASDDAYEAAFERSLALLEHAPMPFERARTLLCHGERLRRARRPQEARHRLRQALATFDELGAGLWSARARAELEAAGGRPRRPPTPRTGSLTPQELQVALCVARGATTREAARALFISPKTVEFHLGNAYGKLGVRNRAELAVRLATQDRAGGGSAGAT
jgi:DNA-binding CsgD family transcriptional regulator